MKARMYFPGVNPVGVNLDVFHPMGRPAPAKLGDMGWVRFGYNVSNARGSEDINAALQRYLPQIEAYRNAGYRVIFATSHQTYGEGKNEFWPWSQMTDAKWRLLRQRFADMMGKYRGAMGGSRFGGCLADLERAGLEERRGFGADERRQLWHDV